MQNDNDRLPNNRIHEETGSMKPRERIIAALEHREADRVPTGENQADPQLAEEILGRPSLANSGRAEREALWDGERESLVADYCAISRDLPLALGWDYVRVPSMPADVKHKRPRMTGPYAWIDEDGYEVAINPDVGNVVVREEFPDMGIDDLPDRDAPFEIDPSELDVVHRVVETMKETHFIVGRVPVDGTFPWAETIGMEDFLVRMVTEPDFVRRATDVYVSRSIAYIDAFLDAGVDAIMTTDDYSDNRGPIMGLDRFREFVLPGLQRQCEAVHRGGGYFVKHTDGNTWPILDAFVELGIDAWHGIQPDIGMDLKLVKERYGSHLCLFGGVNCATLIEGTPRTAREEVRYAIEHAAPGGGLVITCGNVLQPGTQLANYQAARQAVDEFGRYGDGITRNN